MTTIGGGSELQNVRRYREVNIDSDHYLVGIMLRTQSTTPPLINTEAVHNTVIRNTNKGKMDAAINAANRCPGDEASTNDLHYLLKNVIIDTATNIIDPAAKKNRKG